MSQTLSYAEAKEIYYDMRENLDHRDGDLMELYDDMIARAVRYAHIRAGWNALSREQKAEKDSARTSAHDAFIVALNIVARIQGDAGSRWRERLTEDRKRIGDFACYLALFEAIRAR